MRLCNRLLKQIPPTTLYELVKQQTTRLRLEWLEGGYARYRYSTHFTNVTFAEYTNLAKEFTLLKEFFKLEKEFDIYTTEYVSYLKLV
jgi:hypothetical protein